MTQAGFDFSELEAFSDALGDIVRTAPRDTKQFLRKEGSKLARKTRARAMRDVGRAHKKPKKYADSPHYVDTIKRGRVYTYRGREKAVRAYSAAPHAHLIEYGHRLLSHGEEAGFVPGKLIFDKSRREFAPEFEADTKKFVDESLEKLGK